MNAAETTDTTTSPATKAAKGRNVLLDALCERYPVIRDGKPLALGVHTAIAAQMPDASSAQLKLALRIHTASTRYLKALSLGGARFDLEGNPSGEVTVEQRDLATKGLKDRFAKGAERKRQEETDRKAKEADERRNEKLNALAEKFKKH